MRINQYDQRKLNTTYRKIANTIQDFFIEDFKFNRVDKEYLELKLGDDLLELRVFLLLDGVHMSVNFFKGKEVESYLSMISIEETYKTVKNIVKENKGDKK